MPATSNAPRLESCAGESRPASRAGGFDGQLAGYGGLRVREADRLLEALASAPPARLGDAVTVDASPFETFWETPGFMVELLCQPDGSSLVVVGAAVRSSGEAEDEHAELGGLFDALLDVAEAASGVWWTPELGGPVSRADRERFIGP